MRFSLGKVLLLALAAETAVASTWFGKAGQCRTLFLRYPGPVTDNL